MSTFRDLGVRKDFIASLKELNIKDEYGDVVKKGVLVRSVFPDQTDPVLIAEKCNFDDDKMSFAPSIML